MTTTDLLQRCIERVEERLDAVGEALLAGDSERLRAGTTALRDAAAEFSHALSSLPQEALGSDAGLQERIRRVAQRMASHRENLARRSAAVDRALASLLPADVPATYARAPGLGGQGAGRFGSRYS